jgi:hypothetical protein
VAELYGQVSINSSYFRDPKLKYQPRESTLNLPGKCWVNASNYPTTTSLYFFLNLLIIISFDVIWSGILREFSNRQNKNNKMVCVRNFIFIFHILLIYICACANDRIIYVSNFFTVIRKNCNDSVTSYILEGGVRFPVDTGIYFFTLLSELLRGPLTSLSKARLPRFFLSHV